jgi:hypothetical protein
MRRDESAQTAGGAGVGTPDTGRLHGILARHRVAHTGTDRGRRGDRGTSGVHLHAGAAEYIHAGGQLHGRHVCLQVMGDLRVERHNENSLLV